MEPHPGGPPLALLAREKMASSLYAGSAGSGRARMTVLELADGGKDRSARLTSFRSSR
jgi:hypothetical protein